MKWNKNENSKVRRLQKLQIWIDFWNMPSSKVSDAFFQCFFLSFMKRGKSRSLWMDFPFWHFRFWSDLQLIYFVFPCKFFSSKQKKLTVFTHFLRTHRKKSIWKKKAIETGCANPTPPWIFPPSLNPLLFPLHSWQFFCLFHGPCLSPSTQHSWEKTIKTNVTWDIRSVVNCLCAWKWFKIWKNSTSKQKLNGL